MLFERCLRCFEEVGLEDGGWGALEAGPFVALALPSEGSTTRETPDREQECDRLRWRVVVEVGVEN